MSRKISKEVLKQLKAITVSEDLSKTYTVTATEEDMRALEKSGCLMVTQSDGDKYTFVFTYQGLLASEKNFRRAFGEGKKFNTGWLVVPALIVFLAASYVIGYLSLSGVI